MDRNDWMKKLNDESDLSPKEMEELENALQSQGQLWMKSAVSQLPTEEPSMAWRSELNEKLRSMAQTAAPVKTHRRFWWALGPSMAAAGALVAFYLVAPHAQAPVMSSSAQLNPVESQLMEAHDEMAYGADYAVTATPASLTTQNADDDHLFDWMYENYEL